MERFERKRIIKTTIVLVCLLLLSAFGMYFFIEANNKKKDLRVFLNYGDKYGIDDTCIYFHSFFDDIDNTETSQKELMLKCKKCDSIHDVFPRYLFSAYTGIYNEIPEHTKQYMLDGHIPAEDYQIMVEEPWFSETEVETLALASIMVGEDGDLRFPIELADGTIINQLQPNQILLGSEAEKKYTNGDTVWVLQVDESRYFSYFPCQVVGFISEDSHLFAVGDQFSSGTLDDIFVTIEGERQVEEEITSEGSCSRYYGVVSSMKDEAGHRARMSSMSEIVIFPERGSSVEDIKTDLQDVLAETDRIIPYSDIEMAYREQIKPQISRLNMRMLVSGSAVVFLWIVYIVIKLVKKGK